MAADLAIEPLPLPADLRAWFEGALAVAADHPLMLPGAVNTGYPPGSLREIDVILCRRDDLVSAFGAQDQTMGMHLIATADGDPFDEEQPYATRYRVAIAWDPVWIARLVAEDAIDEDDIEIDVEAWLATLTHELQHVLLFAENGNFNSPNDVDTLSGELGHDIFDVSTGYGIRPLLVDGEETWADDIDQARDQMEAHVEERGRIMAQSIFTGPFSAGSFMVVSGLRNLIGEGGLRESGPRP